MSRIFRALALPIFLAALITGGVIAQDASRADADRMGKKVEAIVQRAILAPAKAAPLKTTFTDRELNAYLHHHGTEQLPAGVTKARVTMLDANKLETRAVVDLDAVRTSQPRGWLDPLGYVTGSLEVVTIGMFSGTGGQGVFRYESGTVGGVPIPRAVMQEVIAYYSRSPELPKGINLDQPFPLPAGIREVQVRRGAATVVQ
ncbi:MAG: hypothetical protein IT185_04580 [Acidobacteria bacterium]|nr:hypothetical protein [Acidobacteriota bacterium]